MIERAPLSSLRPACRQIVEHAKVRAFPWQQVSADFVNDLESGAPCPYRMVVATDHERLREIAYWRDILAKIADDIDATAAREDDVKRRRWFDSRSRRIRELLAEPVPPGWSVATSTLGRRR